jgi:hypothetical protein
LITTLLTGPGALGDSSVPSPRPPSPPPCDDNPGFDLPTTSAHRAQSKANEFLGKTAAELLVAEGDPSCRSRNKWRYFRPRGCAYEKEVITLWLQHGRVKFVNIVWHVTGAECAIER